MAASVLLLELLKFEPETLPTTDRAALSRLERDARLSPADIARTCVHLPRFHSARLSAAGRASVGFVFEALTGEELLLAHGERKGLVALSAVQLLIGIHDFGISWVE